MLQGWCGTHKNLRGSSAHCGMQNVNVSGQTCVGPHSNDVRLQRVHSDGVDLGHLLLPGQQQALQRDELLSMHLAPACTPA